jgi:hypothetical protein
LSSNGCTCNPSNRSGDHERLRIAFPRGLFFVGGDIKQARNFMIELIGGEEAEQLREQFA